MKTIIFSENRFDPYNNSKLIFSKKRTTTRYFINKITYDAELEELYLKENDKARIFICKDLSNNNYIAGKIFTEFYKKVKSFKEYEAAKLFLLDIENNLFYSQFFFETMSYLKKGTHPLQKEHIPDLYINDVSKKIYKGVNYFNICYKNMNREEKENIFISNHIINLNHFQYFRKEYLITVLDGIDENENTEKYDMICPRNNLKDLAKKKYYFKNESLLHELEIKEDDENYIKLYKTLNNFFYSAANQTLFKPNKFITSEEIIKYIKENPVLFIEAVKVTGTENLKNISYKEELNGK